VLYFAYGSCMNEADFARTAPKAKRVGTAVLKNYRLAFTMYSQERRGGVADILPADGHWVEGILYKLSPSDWDSLDLREGAPYVYRRKQIQVYLPDQTIRTVTTYEGVNRQSMEVQPSWEYAEIIWHGASELSQDYQRKLKQKLFGCNVKNFHLLDSGEWILNSLLNEEGRGISHG